MRDRWTPVSVMALVLLPVLLTAVASPNPGGTPDHGLQAPLGQPAEQDWPNDPSVDCAKLVTPETIGAEEFERLDLATKLRDNHFTLISFRGFALCANHVPVDGQDDLAALFSLGVSSSTYYLFDIVTHQLLVRYRSLDDGWQERLAALRARESAPRPSPTAASGPIRTVCLSFDTPVEMATEEGEGRTLSELLFDSGCGMEIGDGKICWECSQARQPVLITATGGDGEGGKTCLDVWGAMALAGEEPVEEGNASPPDESCNVSIGGGNHVCWECSARAPESTPLPEEPGTEEVPTGDRAAEPVCADFVTAEAVGAEAFERFKLAEALRTGEIRRTESSPLADEITCYGSRSIGEARVFGDEIFYRFDIHTGQILWERIHWREDLPEQLPSKLISKAEAEAIVGGAVERSYLAYLSPERFPSIVVLIDRLGARHPCWMVLALEGGAELSITYVNVVDAVTGKVLGRYCPC